MPIATLAELYSAGGGRTIESVIRQSGFSLSAITTALEQRFGAELQLGSALIGQAAFSAREAIIEAERIARGTAGDPLELPRNPSLVNRYQYTVLAEAEDTSALGGLGTTVRLPVTVNSDSPLTWQQIQDRATSILERGLPALRSQYAAGNTGTSRDISRMQQLVTDTFGGQFVGSFKPLTAYQRG